MTDREKIGYAIETLKILCDGSKLHATLRYDHFSKMWHVRLLAKQFYSVDLFAALQKAVTYGAVAEGYVDHKLNPIKKTPVKK
jgi:hypothetical protein